MKNSFQKAERLCFQKEMDFLFEKGNSFISYPLRIIFVEKKPDSGADASTLISVSKKKFKRAVKRNRIKRLIREAYRLNKEPFLQSLRERESGMLVGFIFIGKTLSRWDEIETAVVKALKLLQEKQSKNEPVSE
jgi:ribonuclease P protein component